jgi:hypothetical protein
MKRTKIHSPQSYREFGSWFMVHGSWFDGFMVHGSWNEERGTRNNERGTMNNEWELEVVRNPDS